jgi:hypothetical protein
MITENTPVLKSVVDRIKEHCYLRSDDHECKIRARKQRRDNRKYYYLKRAVTVGNQLPAEAVAT